MAARRVTFQIFDCPRDVMRLVEINNGALIDSFAAGYAGPVIDYTGNAYYGFPPHAYQHTPWPIWGGYWDGYGYGRF